MATFEQSLTTFNPARLNESSDWLSSISSKTTITPQRLLVADRTRLTNIPLLGRMYMFHYDPKYKETLPFYDRFPLIFPIASTKVSGTAMSGGGFYGINLHYLPHRLRARLMDALFATITNNKMDETTKLRISYNILNSSAKMRFFSPCVKQYLISHMKSKFFMIQPDEWKTALFLPLEHFQKSSKTAVWKDSTSRIQ